jgi:transcriptional antiterminator RfaH
MSRRNGRRGERRETDPYWTVARYLPGLHRLALAALALAGFETFLPLTRQLVALRWRTMPLFAPYVFVRVGSDGMWRPIERSMGVAALVKFEERPARCPDAEIGRLLNMANPDGMIRLPSARARRPRGISPGVRVRITEGPFLGFEALCLEQTAEARVAILMQTLGAPRRVEIDAGLLRVQ